MENWEYQKYEPFFGVWYATKRLGKGAVGEVYEIQREDLGQIYRSALKIVSIPADEEEVRYVLSSGVKEEDLPQYYRSAIEDLTKEIVAMSRLRGNSNVVSYEDHMTIPHEDGIGWDILMRMELLTPLEEYAREHPLEEEDVIRMGIDLSRALELCQQEGIVHRDVKPDNIFRAPSGSFKLGDFGIAKIAQTSQLTISHKGTVSYMAPEVYRGEGFNGAADVYSLGLVLYKYLNDGRLPFMPPYPEVIEYNDSEIAFRQRMQKKEMLPPSGGCVALQEIVMKACAPDPADRYESPQELREDLEELKAILQESSFDSEGRDSSHGGKNRVKNRAKQEYVSRKKASADTSSVGSSAGHTSGSGKKVALVVATIAAVLLVGAGVYALIPKHIEKINGIQSEETIYIGDTLSPHYVIEPDRFADETISFRGVPKDVLLVDEEGHVTGQGLGEGTLEMTARDYTQVCHITVIPKVSDIGNVKDLTMTEGETGKLKPELSPEKFSKEPISFDSSDPAVASVSAKGKISAKQPGTSDISISAGGCEKTIRLTVEEKPTPVVTYSRSSSSNRSGKSKKSGGSSKGYFDSDKDEFF